MPTGETPRRGPADRLTVRRGGDAADEEVAAIVAAVEAAWPRPAPEAPTEQPPRWRFSGRWWTKPVPLRRNRPW